MRGNFKPRNYVWHTFLPKTCHDLKSFTAWKIYSILSGWLCNQILVKYTMYVNTKIWKMVQINHDQQQWDKMDNFRSSCFWFRLDCMAIRKCWFSLAWYVKWTDWNLKASFGRNRVFLHSKHVKFSLTQLVFFKTKRNKTFSCQVHLRVIQIATCNKVGALIKFSTQEVHHYWRLFSTWHGS